MLRYHKGLVARFKPARADGATALDPYLMVAAHLA